MHCLLCTAHGNLSLLAFNLLLRCFAFLQISQCYTGIFINKTLITKMTKTLQCSVMPRISNNNRRISHGTKRIKRAPQRINMRCGKL